jgi:hypothetical protein
MSHPRTVCVLASVIFSVAGCGGAKPTHRSDSRGSASEREIRTFFNDWYADGRIDGNYPCAVVKKAISRLPTTPPIGSTVYQDFRAYEKRVC